MKDCYKILGVGKNSTAAEIRSAYRKKAKLLHPDITHEDAEAFRELVEAYETLKDLKTRKLFDDSFGFKKYGSTEKKSNVFDYRAWLLERDDDESHAKLIIFDLMHHREDTAVSEFKKMNMTRAGFSMSKWFTREDFMDYGYILSEELILRHEYYDAFIILEQIIKMEYSYSYFRLFFPEVLDLTRHLLRNNMEGHITDELALDAWERALDLGFGKKDDCFFLQKMGDAYERIGDKHTAKICRDESMKLAS